MSEGIRTTAINIKTFFFGFGVTLACILSWLIYHWEITFAILVVAPSLLSLLLSITKMEETPMNLVLSKSPVESLQGFQRIAAINGIECDITEEEIARIKTEYEEN